MRRYNNNSNTIEDLKNQINKAFKAIEEVNEELGYADEIVEELETDFMNEYSVLEERCSAAEEERDRYKRHLEKLQQVVRQRRLRGKEAQHTIEELKRVLADNGFIDHSQVQEPKEWNMNLNFRFH